MPLPVALAVPLLNKASLEDEPLLQEMWANLISNAIDPENSRSYRRAFAEILSQLEPLDAKILIHLGEQGWNKLLGKVTVRSIAEALEPLELDGNEIELCLENLIRLGCIESGCCYRWKHSEQNLQGNSARYRINVPVHGKC